ncbi:kelch domain-containing protein [Microdochium bolleyi]|uniref:Kelch domain-containing protein n=1 Tax=Microdochium bolleyi TaxID=196109 RepID=A0A136ISW9_9PEZI|nr:kelch domain-containing protein [Microdochium bolleyi]
MFLVTATSHISWLALVATAVVPLTAALPPPDTTKDLSTATSLLTDLRVRGSVHGRWITDLRKIPAGPRQEHSVAAVGLEVIVLGGITPPASPTATEIPSLALIEAYAPLTDSWRRIADLPTPMNHANIATAQGKLYVLGGLTGTGVMEPTGNCFRYDAWLDRWETISPMPGDAKRGAAAVAVWKNNVVVAGGLTYLNPFQGVQNTTSKVSAYDTVMRKWSSLPDLPDSGRDHAGGAVWKDTFYVIGGRVSGRNNVKPDVFALDLRNPQDGWKRRASMPTARGGFSLANVHDKFYAFGGEGDKATVNPPTGLYHNVEVYDPVKDKWEVLEPMPVPRHGTGAAVVLGKVYIPGGANVAGSGATDTMQSFTP